MVSIPNSATLSSAHNGNDVYSGARDISKSEGFKYRFNSAMSLIATNPGNSSPHNEAWAQDPLLEASEVQTIIKAFPDNPTAREEAGVLTRSIPVQEAINRVQEKVQGTTDLPNVRTVNPLHNRISTEERNTLNQLFGELSAKLQGIQSIEALQAQSAQPGYTFNVSALSPRYRRQLELYLQLNQSSAISTPAVPPKPNLIHIRNFLTLQMISQADRDTMPANLYYQILSNAANRTIHFNEQIFIPAQWGRYLNQIQAIRTVSTHISEQSAASRFDPDAFLLELSHIVRRDTGNESLVMDILKSADEYDIFSQQDDNLADALGDYFMRALGPQIPAWLWGQIAQETLPQSFDANTPEMAVMQFLANTMQQRENEAPSAQALLFRDMMHPETFDQAAQNIYQFFNVEDMSSLRRFIRLELLHRISLRPFSENLAGNGNNGGIQPPGNGMDNTPDSGPRASFDTQWPGLDSAGITSSSLSQQPLHGLHPLSGGPVNTDSTESGFQPPDGPGGKTAVAASPEEEPDNHMDISIPDYVPRELRILEAQIPIPQYVPNWMLLPDSGSVSTSTANTEDSEQNSRSVNGDSINSSRQTSSESLSNRTGAEQRNRDMETVLGKGWRQGVRTDLDNEINPEIFYPGGFGEGLQKPGWEDYIPGAKEPEFKLKLTLNEAFPQQDEEIENLLNNNKPGKPRFEFPPVPEDFITQLQGSGSETRSNTNAYQLALAQIPELNQISYVQFSRLSGDDQVQLVKRLIEFRQLPKEAGLSLHEYIDSKQISEAQRQQLQSKVLKKQLTQSRLEKSKADTILNQTQIEVINAQIHALHARIAAAEIHNAGRAIPKYESDQAAAAIPPATISMLSLHDRNKPLSQTASRIAADQQATAIPRYMVIRSQNNGRLLIENLPSGDNRILPFILAADTPLTRQQGNSWHNVPDPAAISGQTLLNVLFLQSGIKMLNNGGAVKIPNNTPPPFNSVPQPAH